MAVPVGVRVLPARGRLLIVGADGGVPILGEGRRIHVQDALDDVLGVVRLRPDPAQHAPEDLVAVAGGDVGPEGLAVAVGEVLRAVVELPDGGEALLAAGGVAQPHRGVRVVRADGEVFGHALDEPQRHAQGGGIVRLRDLALPRHVVLEGVDELVPEHVVGLGQGGADGEDDAPLVGLGDAAVPSPGAPPRVFVCWKCELLA
jgi:hypothetical protein